MNSEVPGTGETERRRQTYHSGDVTIVSHEAGPFDGTPVILAHGAGQTQGAWKRALPAGASQGFRMISYDLRGHGESSWSPSEAYGIESHVSDLVAIATGLDRPPFLIGASMGGAIALSYAGQGHPISGIGLVDVAPHVNMASAERIRNFMQSAPEGFATIEEAAAAVSRYLPDRPRPKDASGLRRNLREENGRFHWHWDPVMFAPGRGQRDPEQLRSAARRLTAPALLVRAGQSEVLNDESVEDFLDLVPHAQVTVIESADHMVAGDDNDGFHRAIFDFLERHA